MRRQTRAQSNRRRVRILVPGIALAAGTLCVWISLARPAPPPAPSQPDARTRITWVRIPGGAFNMGSDKGAKDEKPVHRVTIAAFELSRTEVTVDQYRLCVNTGKCSEPDRYDANHSFRKYCNWGQKGRDQHPVNCVDWNQAKAFALWAGGRLPSEAEWEYAARSGDRAFEYPWGNDAPSCQKVVMENGGVGCGKASTWPVCSKPDGNSVHGLCDLAGNVWEWVADMYHRSYKGAPTNGRAWESDKGSNRVVHGGSWNYRGDRVRASYRAWFGPSYREFDLGFRVARAVPWSGTPASLDD